MKSKAVQILPQQIELISSNNALPKPINEARARLPKSHTYTKTYKLSPPPKSIEEQNKLAQELLTWSYESESVELVEFPLSKILTPSSFWKIAEENSYFAAALEIAKENLAVRIKKGWRDKTLDRDYALKMLWQYDMRFKADEKERILLLKEVALAKKDSPITVIIPPVPNSDLVPPLKEK